MSKIMKQMVEEARKAKEIPAPPVTEEYTPDQAGSSVEETETQAYIRKIKEKYHPDELRNGLLSELGERYSG